jgi:hypothetical protein
MRRFWRASALILLVGVTLVVACKREHKPNVPILAETVIADSLVFTRAGSSTLVSMGTTPLVCCGLYDPSFVNERAMRVVFYDPANLKPGWQILILTDRALAGATTTLPTVVVAPNKVEKVSMFVADLATGNELASDTNNSAGTITVHSFSCDASAIRIYFSVDATLGSEFAGGATMDVHGAFEATFPAASCP